MKQHTAIICLASNSKNKESIIKIAIDAIAEYVVQSQYSLIYETDAVGVTPSSPYANCVGQITTTLAIEELNTLMKKMEIKQGRTNQSKTTGVIPLDIDIVVWNNQIVRFKDWEQQYFQIGYSQIK